MTRHARCAARAGSRRPSGSCDGADWPNRASSRFVDAGGLRWHVQVAGSGPALLLVHGTGAATHSWRDLRPLLAGTSPSSPPTCPGTASPRLPRADAALAARHGARLAALLEALGMQPGLAAGHSAGAAILIRMALDGRIAPQALVEPQRRPAAASRAGRAIFSPIARLLSASPWCPGSSPGAPATPAWWSACCGHRLHASMRAASSSTPGWCGSPGMSPRRSA